MAKIPGWLLVLVLGLVLLLPMLGSYGLWDPQEIKLADLAQDVAKSGKLVEAVGHAHRERQPPLTLWLVALGIKALGVNELAGRLPLALCGVLSLLIGYRVLSRMVSRRSGLLGALVLATTPSFVFQSRQLISEVGYYGAMLAAVGGFAAYLWPRDGRRSWLDLCLGSFGLVIGFLAKGLLLGTLFPLVCLALAVLLSWRTSNAVDVDGAPIADGPHLPSGTTIGQALARAALPLCGALLIAAGAIAALLAELGSHKFLLLGGDLQRVALPPTFDAVFKNLGFATFPWFALVPMALAIFVWLQHRDPAQRSRLAFPAVVIAIVVSAGYVLTHVWGAYLGKIRYPALPWLALGVGVLLEYVWAHPKAVHRLWGILAASMLVVIHQDFFMGPETLSFSHLIDYAKYPIDLKIKIPVRIFGLLLALFFLLGLGVLPNAIPRLKLTSPPHDEPRRLRRLLARVRRRGLWLVDQAIVPINLLGDGLRQLAGDSGRRALQLGIATSVAFAGWCAFGLTPALSLHLSNKVLFQEFHTCRSGSEKLAQYQVPGRGAAYYNNGQIEEVHSQPELFQLLRRPERWFILMPASYLAPVDQAARQNRVPYFVLDDRSSQYLLISNKLADKCRQDNNPLRRYVMSTPPRPSRLLSANFENRVQLLGFDLDPVVTRGGKFKITLYFHVVGQMPSGYKLFIHFDTPANRFHGDHEPLDGKYPTQYWLQGDYIVDPHEVEIPLITTPSGTYTVYMGFWLGEQRLKVVEGPNDGANRVQLGPLRVR